VEKWDGLLTLRGSGHEDVDDALLKEKEGKRRGEKEGIGGKRGKRG
jgi:hypothetical protein